jgi:hypothetical protein
MTASRWFGALAVAAITVGLGYAAFETYRRSQPDQCYASKRPIHPDMRTVAIVDGKERVFCCPACALSEHSQEGKPLRVTELTDFFTRAKLSPNDAFIVRGGDVNMCVRTHELMNADKRAAELQYDRCSPSLLAFGRKDEATQYAREHGGEILPFSEIAPAFGQ